MMDWKVLIDCFLCLGLFVVVFRMIQNGRRMMRVLNFLFQMDWCLLFLFSLRVQFLVLCSLCCSILLMFLLFCLILIDCFIFVICGILMCVFMFFDFFFEWFVGEVLVGYFLCFEQVIFKVCGFSFLGCCDFFRRGL